ncbi:MAG: 30S ribosomal protein S1 [Planctomycetes bacterium]|nr:30S ribosomal protein S1 [Planctomycetota bacterium]
MVDQNLISELDATGADIAAELDAMFAGVDAVSQVTSIIEKHDDEYRPGSILKGRVVARSGDDIVVDVGLKSEGLIPRTEWDDPEGIDIGDEVQVWLETVESDSGHIILSKRKADRILNWQRIVDTKKEGDNVRGRVMRKIKGGLLVDIGYPVFLPASQVDIRRPGDIGEFIGKDIDAKILKIDTERRNIVISRRKLIDEERNAAKEALMSTLQVGQIIRGTVKNIADFGAFVDLGGIDGLLHITDMSWDRIGHPSELVKIDHEIEVKVLNIDRDKEKIALGLKQLKVNPWEEVEQRYPPSTRLRGEVVNIMNYGAFVKIEPGVEGLVHISEMSWTRRINHPSEMLTVGDTIDVVVLEVNKNKQEISLGIKQTQDNPWMHVAEKYPPNTRITGRVRNLTNYGAFVEIEEGIDGLLHVSDMSWTKKVNHPSEMLKKGDVIDCVVLNVDQEKQRIALGLKQLHEDPWARAVLENYIPGQIVEGTVTKITNFGVFVELEEDLEGLLHVSELADHKVEDPHAEVKIGDRILVKILRVDAGERKIGLSKKRAEWSADQDADSTQERRPKARRGGLHGPGEETTDIIQPLPFVPPTPPRQSRRKAASPAGEAESSEPGGGDDSAEPS